MWAESGYEAVSSATAVTGPCRMSQVVAPTMRAATRYWRSAGGYSPAGQS